MRSKLNGLYNNFIRLGRYNSCLFSFIIILAFTGCAALESSGQGGKKYSREEANASKLSVFLNLANKDAPSMVITILSIDVMVDSQWLSLNGQPIVIETKKIGNGQMLLLRRPLTPGNYQRFRVLIKQADLLDEAKTIPLKLPLENIELQLEEPMHLGNGDSQSVFIGFDASASISGHKSFQPRFSVGVSPKNILLKDLAFVACPNINTLYFIRTDNNWVYGSIAVSGRPTYLSANIAENRLYVLATDEAMLKVIEISSGRLIDRIQIPMSMEPTFMTVTPNGEWAYFIDSRSDFLTRMHLPSGNLSARVRISDRPQHLLYMQDQGKLAVSVALSQSVLLLDAVTLATIETIPVATSPNGLIAKDGKLYIAGSSTNMVTIYDLAERRILKQINVGFSPRRFGMSDSRIFVTNYLSDSISMLLPGINSVKREIQVGGRPLELAFSKDRRWLYVGDEEPGGLTVIDVTSEKKVDYVFLDTTPAGLVFIQPDN